MKRCYKCQEEKKQSEFNKNKTNKDGYADECRKCKSQYAKEYAKKYPEKAKEYHKKWRHSNYDKITQKKKDNHLKYYYGLSLADRDAMLAAQNNVCFICGTTNTSDREFCIDHDHKTNQIRKLLCGSCNKGLGSFMDNSNNLRKAADYIDYFKALPLEQSLLIKAPRGNGGKTP